MKRIVMAVAAAAMLALTGCATQTNPPDIVSVHYTGGELSKREFVDCLQPGDRSGFDPGDGYYEYPISQRTYDATGGDNAEADPFTVVSKDNAEMRVPATITFTLITDNCDTLREFHERLGNRYKAYFDDGEYGKGWVQMLDIIIGKPLDTTLDRIAQKYTWRALWNDPAAKAEMEKAIDESIDDMVKRQAGGEFFKDFSVLVQKPEPVNEALKNAIASEQSKVAEAQAAEAQARADKIKAEAQIAVSRAEAEKRRAEIAGYGSVENYLRAQAVENGLNPWQPTYLYGSTPAK